ncbi:MAG: hypothetical protein U0166_03130 [Acidobacteriota bacterium]
MNESKVRTGNGGRCDDRARVYVEQMNDGVFRSRRRGECVIGGLVSGDVEAAASEIEPCFTLPQEEPELAYPSVVAPAPSAPQVSTFQEQLDYLASLDQMSKAA